MAHDNPSLWKEDSKVGKTKAKRGRGVFIMLTGRRIRNLSTQWKMGSEIWLSRLKEGV